MMLLCLSREYERNIKTIPNNIPTTTLEDYKIKCHTLLTDIGGDWYLNIMHNPKPPTNNPMLSEKKQQEEDKIKGELKVAYDHWKDRKFQIGWKNYNMSCHLNEILRRLHFICLLTISI